MSLAPIVTRMLDGDVGGVVRDLDVYRAEAEPLAADDPARSALAVAEGWAALRGAPAEGAETLQALVGRLGAGPPSPLLMLAVLGLGTGRVLAGNVDAGAPPLERALLLGAKGWSRAHALRFLAHCLEIREDFVGAAARYAEAFDAYTGGPADAFAGGNAEYGAGAALVRAGQVADGIVWLTRAVATLDPVPGVAWSSAMRELALAEAEADPREARARMAKARSRIPRDGSPGDQEAAYGEAYLELLAGHADACLAALPDALAAGVLRHEGALLRTMAHAALGDLTSARAALPPRKPGALGDVPRFATIAWLEALSGDAAKLDAALTETRRALSRVRADLQAVFALKGAAAALGDDPNRAAQCLALALQAGMPPARGAAALYAMRVGGAPVPLGELSLDRLLGEGGMGQVWHAVHAERGQEVVVKLLRIGEGRFPTALRRLFEAEVQAAARLDHPNIVQTLAAVTLDAGAAAMLGQPEGSPGLVLEFVRGGTMSDQTEGWTWPRLRAVVSALLDALAHAHARGIVHLDVKPENILLERLPDGGWSPRLTDFGLAGVRTRGVGGRAFGTPAYMAPEQARGSLVELGPWTDLYAVGGLVWRMVVGATPFSGDATALVEAQISTPLPAFEPEMAVPAGLEAWLNGLLAKDKGERFERAADALAALAALGEAQAHAPVRSARADSGKTYGPGDGRTTALVPVPTWSPAAAASVRPRPPIAPFPARWGLAASDRTQVFLPGVGEGLLDFRVPRTIGATPALDAVGVALRALHGGDTTGGKLFVVLGPSGSGRSHCATRIGEVAHASGAAHVVTIGPSGRAEPLALPRSRRPRLVVVDDVDRHPIAAGVLGRWREEGAVVIATGERWNLDLAPDATFTLGVRKASEVGLVLDQVLPLARGTRGRLAKRAEGNLGFAMALLGDLVRSRDLVRGPEGFELRTDAAPRIARDRLAVWVSRVDALARPGTPRRAAWEIAALLGADLRLDEWRRACALAGLGDVEDAAAVLTAAGWWLVADGGARFVRLVVREALLDGAVASERATAWHDVCAQVVDGPDRQGRHLAGAGRGREALPLLRAGAADAVNAARIAEARELLAAWHQAADAIGMATDDPARAGIAVVHTHLAFHTGEDPLPMLEAALPWVAGRGDREETRVWYTLGAAYRNARRFEDAAGAFHHAIAIEQPGPSEMLGLAWLGLAGTLGEAGRDGCSEALSSKSVFEALASPLTGLADLAYGANLAQLGRFAEARPALWRAVAASRRETWPQPEREALTWLAEAEVAAGDGVVAIALAREARAALASTGSDRAVDAEIVLASVLLIFGEDAEANSLIGATEARFSGGVGHGARPLLALCRLLLSPDRPDIEDRVREAMATGRPVISPILQGLVRRLAARHVASGDAARRAIR